MFVISHYVAAACVVGLTNVGDYLESQEDPAWFEVARAAALIEALLRGHVDLAKFAEQAGPLCHSLGEISAAQGEASLRIGVILGHARTLLDGLRLGFARIERMVSDEVLPPPAADHPMLEVRHA